MRNNKAKARKQQLLVDKLSGKARSNRHQAYCVSHDGERDKEELCSSLLEDNTGRSNNATTVPASPPTSRSCVRKAGRGGLSALRPHRGTVTTTELIPNRF